MLSGALLSIVEDACTAVLTLAEGLEEAEFLGSRLTRREVARQLRTLTDTLANLPPGVCARLPELDWDGWRACAQQLAGPAGSAQDEALWFALRSLAPATLMWLRVHRQSQPALFSFMP